MWIRISAALGFCFRIQRWNPDLSKKSSVNWDASRSLKFSRRTRSNIFKPPKAPASWGTHISHIALERLTALFKVSVWCKQLGPTVIKCSGHGEGWKRFVSYWRWWIPTDHNACLPPSSSLWAKWIFHSLGLWRLNPIRAQKEYHQPPQQAARCDASGRWCVWTPISVQTM